MRQDLTRIAIVLDRSASMATIQEATISGFNEFINTQRLQPGYATVKLVQFDDQYEVAFDQDVREVPALTHETFQPRGMTALHDAMGRTIDVLGKELARKPESERPARVLVAIITDGGENASREYTRERIADMVKHQQERYNWSFVFIGANQDAVLTAKTFNIAAQNALTYTANADSVRGMTRSLGVYTNAVRSNVASVDCAFTDEDRKNANIIPGSTTVSTTTGSGS